MHNTVFSIDLISETKQILANNYGPMLFEAVSSCFEEAFTFQTLFSLLYTWIITKVLNDSLSEIFLICERLCN
jgi:hypothetical protein